MCAATIHLDDRTTAGGRARTHTRTALRLEEEIAVGKIPFRGLWGLRAVHEGFKIQDMEPDGGRLRIEGTTGAFELHSMEGFLLGVHDRRDHSRNAHWHHFMLTRYTWRS